MGRGDLALLKDLARDGSLFQGYHPRMKALHQRHATRLAALIDAHGWPQRYGTQFDWDEHGHLSPLPLEDPAGVDARRRAIGLGPLAQDLWRRRWAMARGRWPERPPAAWAARQREMETWLRQVGWRD